VRAPINVKRVTLRAQRPATRGTKRSARTNTDTPRRRTCLTRPRR
jgi:hypothetical protein